MNGGWWLDPYESSRLNITTARSRPMVYRVQPGEWLGPWVLCHALRAAVMASRPFGIALHVLAEPGGGAPVLYQSTLLQTYFPSSVAAQTGAIPLLTSFRVQPLTNIRAGTKVPKMQ